MVDVHAIDVAELQKAINRLLDQVRATGVECLAIEQPHYWKVLEDDKFLMSVKPSGLGVGYLVDELDSIGDALEPGDDTPTVLLYDLASLLSYVAVHATDQLSPHTPSS